MISPYVAIVGIPITVYKEAVSTKSDIPFRCHMCTTSFLTETDQGTTSEATNNTTETELQSDITPIGQPVLESTRIGNHSIR